jgi:hypothetical protein
MFNIGDIPDNRTWKLSRQETIWENNIETDLNYICCVDVELLALIACRIRSSGEHL